MNMDFDSTSTTYYATMHLEASRPCLFSMVSHFIVLIYVSQLPALVYCFPWITQFLSSQVFFIDSSSEILFRLVLHHTGFVVLYFIFFVVFYWLQLFFFSLPSVSMFCGIFLPFSHIHLHVYSCVKNGLFLWLYLRCLLHHGTWHIWTDIFFSTCAVIIVMFYFYLFLL